MTIGETTSSVAATTLEASFTLRRQGLFQNNKSARARKKLRYKGLTRNQQATPSRAPDAMAHARLLRFAASSRHHSPPSTNQVVGASAVGETPYIASNGDNATRKLVTTPARQP